MLVEFTHTPEDLREITMLTSEYRRQQYRRGRADVFFMSILVVYYLGMKILWQFVGEKNPLEIWINLLIPSAAVMVAGLALGSLAMMTIGTNARPGWRSVFSLIALVGLVAVIRWTMYINPAPRAANAWPSWKILLPHCTWLMFMILVIGLMMRSQSSRRLWEKQPTLHRARSADISAIGVAISDPVTRLEYKWDAFVHCAESRNMFLLILPDRSGVMIPKRAFAGDEQIDAMRALSRLIRDGRPSGFPVLPLAA